MVTLISVLPVAVAGRRRIERDRLQGSLLPGFLREDERGAER
jgi:hypothetical protein